MIHKYFLNGYYIVLDVNSGAIHVVDELIYNMLDLVEPPVLPKCPQSVLNAFKGRYNLDEIYEAYDEIYGLYDIGQLYSEDDYEQFAGMMVNSPIKAMCLHIAHDCNLRCEYCFASTGDFGEGRRLMTYETGKKAIDFLIEHSQGRRNLEMDFFGGEPLMNFGVVKQLVEYARSLEEKHHKKFRFTITTNGMLLTDDKIDFINKEMSNVVLSIDGRKEVTDRVRSRVDGSGCYDVIMPKFQKLVEKRGPKDYYVRGTFTKYNLDFTKDVLHLYDAGFDQISVEPVVSDPALPYSITENDLPVIFDEYETLAQTILACRKAGRYFNFFHFMLDLDQGPCAIKRLRGCGCGNEYVAITPDGDIYPCHQFVGQEEWKMGNLEDGSFDKERKADFATANVYTKPECKECWAKFYCSGGCNANNQNYEGDIRHAHKLSCDLEKKRLECAIMIKAAEAQG
ncbi:thioether cross-link-forming SCIFF peptide maturase [Candidatus Soleaferrea massiliensis]|uniref:thioether cross-link-forming SCIFF peptide maturase n=1 Tax=Candidatus Soleaferrea massiliensis TaxID=1470354 RepID=UPI00058AC5C0|nr:thioether cross-link-forming SCIFF peptide maturase [Candidatus Soleaferrea massiliensis]